LTKQNITTQIFAMWVMTFTINITILHTYRYKFKNYFCKR
jgi:hypothetical protein